ncbi:hypothetical protein J2755_001535 [Methanohalophilus levihalophilus]|uniref:DUF11 domain-containing protein n=1 Tax=Methanohalophilus levihalophilus TaxID=1431282 RepID=UPI001AE3DAFA|nr:DUF11 domain-containing protein [Methanohalophilus levihalophilus]MBP2030587.1 hypothetical protein [Methanohalophilus levihalophilus]
MNPCPKIIIVFILLSLFCIPALGYDYQHEEIWIHQGTFTIGDGERAETGIFTIRNYAPEGEGFRILFYRNGDYADDFYLDDSSSNEYVYDSSLKIATESISDGTITVNVFQREFEKVWIFRERHRISPGEVIDYSDVSVELLELNEAEAVLKNTYNGEEAEEQFEIRDVKQYGDTKVRLTFIDIDSVVIEFYGPGVPALEVVAGNLSESYRCNETVNVEVIVKNTGEIPLRGVNLMGSLDTGSISPDSFQTEIINPGKSKSAIFEVRPPVSPVDKEMMIKFEVEASDYLANELSAETSKSTTAEPFISISKEHEGNILSLTNVDDSTLEVFLTVSNYAPSDTSVNVRDEIPDSFLLIDYDSPEWDVIVPAESSRKIEYTIAANVPGNFTLPSAAVEYNHQGGSYEINSNIPGKVVVEGTKIGISKSSDIEYAQEGDIVWITLTAINEGTTEATVEINDDIPAGIEFVSGETAWSGSLEPQQTKILKYVILAGADDFQLPAAELNYQTANEKGKEVSNILTIFSGEETLEETVERIETEQMGRLGITGFLLKAYLAVFSIILIGPFGVYLYINRRH